MGRMVDPRDITPPQPAEPRPAPEAAQAPDATAASDGEFGAVVADVAANSLALDPRIASRLKRGADGLIPAIAQQYDTGEVLMLAWMDDEALRRTLTTGRATYWSRSRAEYWVKGESSGNVQRVVSVALDCDADTLLLTVDQTGPACHTGSRS